MEQKLKLWMWHKPDRDHQSSLRNHAGRAGTREGSPARWRLVGEEARQMCGLSDSGGTLSVTDGVHTANIALLGQYDPAGFQTEADKNAGTLISYHHLA